MEGLWSAKNKKVFNNISILVRAGADAHCGYV